MSSTPQPLSRRGALLAGTAALVGGLGPAGRTDAAARIPKRSHVPLNALTPAQRAGQCVIHSYPGLEPPARLMDAIREGRTAGVIFFAENIKNLSQIEGVVQEMNEAHASAPVNAPLLLMTDQEGGMVRRLPGEPVLSAKDVGASADPEGQSELTGSGAGSNLAGVGMNVNLAPVLDVYRTAGDFTDQYERSYSKDPAAVATCGSAFITAQQDAAVAATAKHFPGLGPASADQNTDLGPSPHPRRPCVASTRCRTGRRSPPGRSWSCSPGPSTRRWTRTGPPACPRSWSANCGTGSASRA